jgi:hypothetical protein
MTILSLARFSSSVKNVTINISSIILVFREIYFHEVSSLWTSIKTIFRINYSAKNNFLYEKQRTFLLILFEAQVKNLSKFCEVFFYKQKYLNKLWQLLKRSQACIIVKLFWKILYPALTPLKNYCQKIMGVLLHTEKSCKSDVETAVNLVKNVKQKLMKVLHHLYREHFFFYIRTEKGHVHGLINYIDTKAKCRHL